MKYKIIENSNWEFLVKYKYKYRPFWIKDTSWRGDVSRVYWLDSFKESKERLKELIKKEDYREEYKIIYFN